jgi:hypothetical protein
MDKARWKEEEACDVCVEVEQLVGAYIRRGGQEARGKKLYSNSKSMAKFDMEIGSLR